MPSWAISGADTQWKKVVSNLENLHKYAKPDEVDEARLESAERCYEEVGDLLFAVANLARHLSVDPEAALATLFDIPDGYSFHGQIVHYPALVLIDPQGREAFRYVGQNNGDRYAFDDFAAKIAELEAIPKRERTPNGRHFSLARRPH